MTVEQPSPDISIVVSIKSHQTRWNYTMSLAQDVSVKQTHIYTAKIMWQSQTDSVCHKIKASTFAFFIQLNTACKKHFITRLDRPGSKNPGHGKP